MTLKEARNQLYNELANTFQTLGFQVIPGSPGHFCFGEPEITYGIVVLVNGTPQNAYATMYAGWLQPTWARQFLNHYTLADERPESMLLAGSVIWDGGHGSVAWHSQSNGQLLTWPIASDTMKAVAQQIGACALTCITMLRSIANSENQLATLLNNAQEHPELMLYDRKQMERLKAISSPKG